MADLLGADPGGVVFGRSMTALTFDLSRTLAKEWGPGDEIVVTRLDHDANIRPWVHAAEAVGRHRPLGRLRSGDRRAGRRRTSSRAVTDRTRLVAVTGASNLIGTRPDLPRDRRAGARRRRAALRRRRAPHRRTPRSTWPRSGADFFACSPYKFLGPHCGVLAAAPALLETLHPDKLLPSTDAVPERFELGTLPYELLAGTTAAVDFLAALAGPPRRRGSRRERLVPARAALEEYEDDLRDRIEAALASLPGGSSHSRAVHRTPTLLLTFDGRDPATRTRPGRPRSQRPGRDRFYAIEASRRLGLGDAGGLRVGLAPYRPTPMSTGC